MKGPFVEAEVIVVSWARNALRDLMKLLQVLRLKYNAKKSTKNSFTRLKF